MVRNNKFLFGAFVLLVAALSGCGGGTAGTSGTGGGAFKSREITGVLSDTDGAPVAGAIVEVEGGDASTSTDPAGNFNLIADTGTTVSLSIDTGSGTPSTLTTEIEPATTVVTVDAVIDLKTNTVNGNTITAVPRVNGVCSPFSAIRGSSIKLDLPSGAYSCSLTYELRSSSGTPVLSGVVVRPSGCGGVTFTNVGAQNVGSALEVYQEVRVKNQRGTCSAGVTIEVPNAKVNPEFKLTVNQSSPGGAQPTPNPAKTTYAGRLTGPASAPQCPRFGARRTAMRFTLKGTTMTATFRDEGGLSVSGEINQSEISEFNRYVINAPLSGIAGVRERIEIRALNGFGGQSAAFSVAYFAEDSDTGASICERNFFGTLD